MVLCEMPEEMVNQRNDYYAQMTNNLMQSVEQDMNRAETPGQPIQSLLNLELVRTAINN